MSILNNININFQLPNSHTDEKSQSLIREEVI